MSIYNCEQCQQKFSRRWSLTRHVGEVHGHSFTESENNSDDETVQTGEGAKFIRFLRTELNTQPNIYELFELVMSELVRTKKELDQLQNDSLKRKYDINDEKVVKVQPSEKSSKHTDILSDDDDDDDDDADDDNNNNEEE